MGDAAQDAEPQKGYVISPKSAHSMKVELQEEELVEFAS